MEDLKTPRAQATSRGSVHAVLPGAQAPPAPALPLHRDAGRLSSRLDTRWDEDTVGKVSYMKTLWDGDSTNLRSRYLLPIQAVTQTIKATGTGQGGVSEGVSD